MEQLQQVDVGVELLNRRYRAVLEGGIGPLDQGGEIFARNAFLHERQHDLDRQLWIGQSPPTAHGFCVNLWPAFRHVQAAIVGQSSEKNIMSRVEEKDPELAEEIRKLMFVFEDLIFVDDKGIQTLLKEVDNGKLVIALKTAPEDIKTKLFKNMSNRAATMLLEDLEALGPTKLSDVEKAQAEIVNKAKELEGQGKAFISRGGEGDALV